MRGGLPLGTGLDRGRGGGGGIPPGNDDDDDDDDDDEVEGVEVGFHQVKTRYSSLWSNISAVFSHSLSTMIWIMYNQYNICNCS